MASRRERRRASQRCFGGCREAKRRGLEVSLLVKCGGKEREVEVEVRESGK